jgi:phenylalanyl-tRNA synthetase beta chain
MKVSYNWLQTYFKDPLPSPEKLIELITFHAFEIEGTERIGADTIIDVKVLPDRACYALSHRGIAFEVSAITGLAFQNKSVEVVDPSIDTKVKVTIEDPEAVPRYMAEYIQGVNVGPSPEWLKKWLEAIGQRSINTVVDATNFILNDLGQPLHAFDADKVKGGITVRRAKETEQITTLDGKEVKLDTSILVIADDQGPLAVAGVKGGIRAAVTERTKNIIIESASFNPTLVRRTSQKIGIRTDASKRFENTVPPERAPRAMEEVTALIVDMSDDARVGPITDISHYSAEPKNIVISSSYIREMLGVDISTEEIKKIITVLGLSFSEQGDILTVHVPAERIDLIIPQDMVEEIGRIYGYEKIPATELPPSSRPLGIDKLFYYSTEIRNFLISQGFSEVYTYSLTNKGEVEIVNPLASDKGFLRSYLAEGIAQKLLTSMSKMLIFWD